MLQIGLRLHDGEALPLEQLLPLVRAKGFSCVHMALSKSMAEYPFGPSALTAGYAGYLRRQFAKNELDIAVLGNYLNLADPDEAALSAAKERYYAHPLCRAAWVRHGGHRDRRAQQHLYILPRMPFRRRSRRIHPQPERRGALCGTLWRHHCH